MFAFLDMSTKMESKEQLLTYYSEIESRSSGESKSSWVSVKRKFHGISHRVEDRLTTQGTEINQSQSSIIDNDSQIVSWHTFV